MCNMKALNIYYFGVMTTNCHFFFTNNMSNVKVNRIITTRKMISQIMKTLALTVEKLLARLNFQRE